MASFEDKLQQAIRMYPSPWGIINAAILRPTDPKYQIPVILAQGWSETTTVLKSSIEQLFSAGRIVIALDHPRRGGAIDHYPNYPIDELRKALTIREIIQQESLPLVDFVAHSEGAINAAIAAFLEPKRVRNIILVDPAGLSCKDIVPVLVGRFVRKTWQNFINNVRDKYALRAVMVAQKEVVKYCFQNPSRAYKEIVAISRLQINWILKALHDEGIGIVVIHGVDDVGFPMARIQKVITSENRPDGFVDGFLSVKGGHDELYLHPEQYMGAAEKMLAALEQKQAGESAHGQKPLTVALSRETTITSASNAGFTHTSCAPDS